ncbi:MAG: hypothetical protein ACK5UE_01345 [Chitinophagales bacterium]|jgi:hypothetical protein|nr:hypothetical protein [Sphingobacteriales bacterium]
MSKSIYFGWLFVVILLFVSALFQFVRHGFGLKTILGLAIAIVGVFFLRYYKSRIH